MRTIIQTALYHRNPTKEEIGAGVPKSKITVIAVPLKDVFLGVDDLGEVVLKRYVKGEDGLRYYFRCFNFLEPQKLIHLK